MSELRPLTNHFCSPFRGRGLWCRFAPAGGNLILQRREDAYICVRNSLDFSEFRVVSWGYSLEDSHDYAPSPNSISLEAESSKISQIYIRLDSWGGDVVFSKLSS
jgi:hypothetical protein